MRSRHVDDFNHDPWADDYDENVRNGADPIRAGYADVLAWTVAQARIAPSSVVMDLGTGTGNTAARITAAAQLLCVDVSPRMMSQAVPKLGHLPRVDYVYADLLEYVVNSAARLEDGICSGQADPGLYDAVISTYAIHHLTEEEKPLLFAGIHALLRPGGRAVFGDLMFRNPAEEVRLAAEYTAAGRVEVAADFEEEFFWYVDRAIPALDSCGFTDIRVKRFSTLSWGIATRKEPTKKTDV